MAIAFTATHTKTLISPSTGTADKVYGDDYVSATSHSVAVSGLSSTSGAVLYSTDATTLAQDANFTWKPSGAAGQGLVFAAGTATTDVAAFSLTRTNNNAAVATGVKWTFTDTTSAGGFLPFQILGGNEGTTNLLNLNKSGSLALGGSISLASGTQSLSTEAGSLQLSAVSGDLILSGDNIFANAVIQIGSVSTSISELSAGLIGVGTGAAGSFAGSLKLTNTQNVGYAELDEMTAPAGAANSARLFTQDNGAGKTQLMCIFGSGAAIQVAIEV